MWHWQVWHARGRPALATSLSRAEPTYAYILSGNAVPQEEEEVANCTLTPHTPLDTHVKIIKQINPDGPENSAKFKPQLFRFAAPRLVHLV